MLFSTRKCNYGNLPVPSGLWKFANFSMHETEICNWYTLFVHCLMLIFCTKLLFQAGHENRLIDNPQFSSYVPNKLNQWVLNIFSPA